MGHYKSNLRDLEFNLFEVFGRGEVLGSGPYAEVDADTAREMLKEVARLSENELAESFADADRNPPVYDPATHSVTMPESFTKSYRAYVDSGFWNVDASLFKRFAFNRTSLELRLEAVNVFNHVNLGNPDTTIGVPGNDNPNAGRITSAAPNWQARNLQFGVRFQF